MSNLVDDGEEVLENPLLERGWEYKDMSGIVKGIFPSEVVYRWKLRGMLGRDQQVREVGTVGWSPLALHELLLRQRAIARTAWKLFGHEPELEWIYKDAQNVVRGPFPSAHMWTWFEGGLLYRSLMVSARLVPNENQIVQETLFAPLDSLLEAYLLEDNVSPDKLIRQITLERMGPVTPGRSEPSDETEIDGLLIRNSKDAVLSLSARKLSPYSLRLWMPKGQKIMEWFYMDRQIIYGPYDGSQMHMWFCEGSLPEDLEISSREKVDVEDSWEQHDGRRMSFVKLGEALFNTVQEMWGCL